MYDKIPGGLAKGKSLKDIAKHHKVPTKHIISALKKGIEVEKEHTTDESIAKEVAMDHLWEDPKYYEKLKKIEVSENLDEAKNIGNLYHFTSFDSFIGILKTNKLINFNLPNGNSISLTRDKNLWRKDVMIGGFNVRIVIDGNKLSENYKINPYNDVDYSWKDGSADFEAEERVKGNIKDLDKYVISYDVEIPVNFNWDPYVLKKLDEIYTLSLKNPKIKFYYKNDLVDSETLNQQFKQVAEIKKKADKYGIKAYTRELALGLEEVLSEGKNVGILYHFTTPFNAKKIIEQNEIKPFYEYISFTRNKNLFKQNPLIGGTEIRLILDGNKISDNYKLETYNDSFSIKSPNLYGGNIYKDSYPPKDLDDIKIDSFEAEERIKGSLKNLDKYLISLDVVDPLSLSNDSLNFFKNYPKTKWYLNDKLVSYEEILITKDKEIQKSEEEYSKIGNSLKEYQNQKILNPNLWEGDQLKEKYKEGLLKIAKYFINKIDPKPKIDDIILTGSSVNYNWTQYSDIDLHVLLDFKQFKDPEMSKKYLDNLKNNWNKEFDLKIGNNEVELYFQDTNEPHAAQGVYSLLEDKWLKKPTQEDVQVSDEEINKKAIPFKQQIDSLQQLSPEEALPQIEKIKDKIKRFRKCGLEGGGEYSVENLAFKELRNSGYLEKINLIKKDDEQKELSSFINEGKNIGNLYHFTTIISAQLILKQNKIKSYRGYYKGKPNISFTRNKDLWKQKPSISGIQVRLVLDGNKLSDKYKIESYDYMASERTRDIYLNREKYLNKSVEFEAEERVLTEEIDNLDKYLISIDIINPDEITNISGVEFFEKYDKFPVKFFDKKGNLIPDYKEKQNKKQVAESQEVKDDVEKQKLIEIKKYTKLLFKFLLDKKLNIKPLPKIKFVYSDVIKKDPAISPTGHYDRDRAYMTIYTRHRGLKDILKTILHETIHHIQNLEDRLGNISTTNVTQDKHLKKIEGEAYLKGGLIFREFEEWIKENSKKHLKEETEEKWYSTKFYPSEHPSVKFDEKHGTELSHKWFKEEILNADDLRTWVREPYENEKEINKTFKQIIFANPKLKQIKIKNIQDKIDILYGVESRFNFNDINNFVKLTPNQPEYNKWMDGLLKNLNIEKDDVQWVVSPETLKIIKDKLKLDETPYEDNHPELKYWALYANIYDKLKKDPEKVYNLLKDKLKGEQLKALDYFYPMAKDPILLKESKEYKNPQEIVYDAYGGPEDFIKDQLLFLYEKYPHFDVKRQLKPKIEEVSINELIPVQEGDNYWNESSKAQAESFKDILSGKWSKEEIPDKIGRKADFNPILVDKSTNRIIDGHHRHASLRAVKSPTAWVIYVDLHMPIRDANNTEVDYLLENKLKEGKQVGILYHYTSFNNFLKIFEENSLKPKNNNLSFTRSKNFHKISRHTIGGVAVRLTIDGDKLSNKYKIEPYDAGKKYGDEYEERLKGSNTVNYLKSKGISNPSQAQIDSIFDREEYYKYIDWKNKNLKKTEIINLDKYVISYDFFVDEILKSYSILDFKEDVLDKDNSKFKYYKNSQLVSKEWLEDYYELKQQVAESKLYNLALRKDPKGLTWLGATILKDVLEEIKPQEQIKYDGWVFPSQDVLKREYYVEHELKGREEFPTEESFLEAIKDAKVEEITKETDKNINYRVQTKNFDDLLSLIKTFKSYPDYRNENTLKGLYQNIKDNKPLDMPIVMEYENGSRRILVGNTRMNVAFQLGVNPKVLIIKVPQEKKMVAESKNIGTLYHFTNIKNLLDIKKDNILKVSGKKESEGYVSFTRDKNLYKYKGLFIGVGSRIQARLVLDGNKLSDKYKIEPYNYFVKGKQYEYGDQNKRIWKTYKSNHPDDGYTESEERIKGGIRDLDKYVISYDILLDKVYLNYSGDGFLEYDYVSELTKGLLGLKNDSKVQFYFKGKPIDFDQFLEKNYSFSFSKKKVAENVDKQELENVELQADRELSPIDVSFSDHFFERVNDPRNEKEIYVEDLFDFFEHLAKNKEKLVSFLKKYKQIVVRDNKNKINIPFVKVANKILAKTIMVKSNFHTPNPQLIMEGKNIGVIYHNTSFPNFLQILNSNILKSKDVVLIPITKNNPKSLPKGVIKTISFTRDKNFGYDKWRSVSVGVRIVVDGNKLSENYKIEPYNDYYSLKGHDDIGVPRPFEAEQILIFNRDDKYPWVKDFDKYVISYDIDLTRVSIAYSEIEPLKNNPKVNFYYKGKLIDIDKYERYGKLHEPHYNKKYKYIAEGKQVGDVYHFTSISNLLQILADNKLSAGDIEFLKNDGTISTTRDKDFIKRRGTEEPVSISGEDVALILDGDKLSDKYKVKPYDYGYDQGDNEVGDEQEELWYGKKINQQGGIRNLNKYIKGIIFTPRFSYKKDFIIPLKYNNEDFILKYDNKLEKIDPKYRGGWDNKRTLITTKEENKDIIYSIIEKELPGVKIETQ